jgi:SPP1 family predicted phage head-tail adaptor
VIDSGSLDQRITIIQPTESGGTYGSSEPTYGTGTEIWAEVKYVRGTESYRSHRIVADADYMIRVRKRSDVTPKTRITWGSLTLDVISAGAPDPRGDETVIQCKVRDA